MNKDEILTQVICAMISAGEMKTFNYESKLEKAVEITNKIIEICDKGIYYKENVV